MHLLSDFAQQIPIADSEVTSTQESALPSLAFFQRSESVLSQFALTERIQSLDLENGRLKTGTSMQCRYPAPVGVVSQQRAENWKPWLSWTLILCSPAHSASLLSSLTT